MDASFKAVKYFPKMHSRASTKVKIKSRDLSSYAS